MERTPYDILVAVGGHDIANEAVRILTEEGWRLVLVGPCQNPEAGMNCGCKDLTILEEYHPHI